MAGMFELFSGSDASYRFRLTAPDGTVMALSRSFPDKPSAVAGIAAVREYAGMGLVCEIPAPGDDGAKEPAAARVPSGATAQNRVRQENPAADGASGARARLPRIRIPSAAHFLGGRAVARNHQMMMRWRRAPGAAATPAGLSPC